MCSFDCTFGVQSMEREFVRWWLKRKEGRETEKPCANSCKHHQRRDVFVCNPVVCLSVCIIVKAKAGHEKSEETAGDRLKMLVGSLAEKMLSNRSKDPERGCD